MIRKYRHYSLFERFLSYFTWVKAGEGRSVFYFLLSIFTLMFAYYQLKVIREPLLLATGTAELKSYTTAAQALLLIIIVPLFTRYYHHSKLEQDKSKLLRNILFFFVTNLVVFFLLGKAGVPIGIAFYIWLGIFSVMAVALFWAFAADCFNIKSGQRLFVIIASGGSLGAWLGTKSAGYLSKQIDAYSLMLVSGFLILIVAFLIKQCYTSIPEDSSPPEEALQEQQNINWSRGFSLVFKKKYLLQIALLVLLVNWINTSGEYILTKLVIEASLTAGAIDPEARQSFITAFYASYIGWFTLAGLLLQLFVVSRLFRLIGVGASVLILPIVALINYGFILFFPILAVARLGMIAENSVNYSIQNTSRQALFLSVPREQKYVCKNTIDTFFYRFGDLLQGASIAIGVNIFGLGTQGFVIFNLFLGSLLLWVAILIKRRNEKYLNSKCHNEAPYLSLKIEDKVISAGMATSIKIPENTFIDPDRGDSLRYEFSSSNSGPLPEWISINKNTLELMAHPPEDYQADLNIKISVKDFEGLEASTQFKLSVSDASSNPNKSNI